VAPTKIIAGLAKSVGMRLLHAPGVTGDARSDLAAKAAAMAAALRDAAGPTFGLLHVKAVDDCGHDRDCQGKVAYLAACDALLGQLAARLHADGTRCLLCCTGDHSTPVLYGDHSHESVPLAAAHLHRLVGAVGQAAVEATWLGQIRTPELEPEPGAEAFSPALHSPEEPTWGDDVFRFDELSAARGGLGRFPGRELMPFLKAFAACGDAGE
jgi:2,3-bisphosphoglycerate-independent phosphoglycerate mutase